MTEFEDASPEEQIAEVLAALNIVADHLPSYANPADLDASIDEVSGLPSTEAGARRAVLIGRLWTARMVGDWLGAEAAANRLNSEGDF